MTAHENFMSDNLNNSQPRAKVEEYISKKEVAARLKQDERTVNNWMRLGLLPYYKIGRTVRFKWSEVEAFFEQHCRVVPRRESPSQSLAE